MDKIKLMEKLNISGVTITHSDLVDIGSQKQLQVTIKVVDVHHYLLYTMKRNGDLDPHDAISEKYLKK